MKSLLALSLCLLCPLAVVERISFDENWRFFQKDAKGAEAVDLDDTGWRVLDLPHDWSVEGKFDRRHPTTDRCGYLPTGIAWYRKSIEVPADWKGKRVAIPVWVYSNCSEVELFLNGESLGRKKPGTNWLEMQCEWLVGLQAIALPVLQKRLPLPLTGSR